MTPSATDPLNKFNATEVLADTARAALAGAPLPPKWVVDVALATVSMPENQPKDCPANHAAGSLPVSDADVLSRLPAPDKLDSRIRELRAELRRLRKLLPIVREIHATFKA